VKRSGLQSWALAAVAVTVVAAACTDQPLLEDVGDVSQRVVHGDTTSSTAPVLTDEGGEAVGDVARSSTLAWFNRELADVEGVEAAVVLNRVWTRGEGVNRCVQAGPREIATPRWCPTRPRW
jgi:hypothetical protein